jgi:hypothetical protein
MPTGLRPVKIPSSKNPSKEVLELRTPIATEYRFQSRLQMGMARLRAGSAKVSPVGSTPTISTHARNDQMISLASDLTHSKYRALTLAQSFEQLGQSLQLNHR